MCNFIKHKISQLDRKEGRGITRAVTIPGSPNCETSSRALMSIWDMDFVSSRPPTAPEASPSCTRATRSRRSLVSRAHALASIATRQRAICQVVHRRRGHASGAYPLSRRKSLRRKKLDLTQDEMATVLGTSPSGYKKWEQGKSSRVALRAPCFAPWRKEPEAVLRALSSEKETTITLSTVGKGLFLQPGHPPVTLKDRDGADMCALAAITDRMTTSTHGSTNSTGRVEN